jgi:hypothetical protein
MMFGNAIKLALATLLGTAALYTQGYDLPKQYINGATNRGTPVYEVQDDGYFIGLVWQCYKDEAPPAETCWAGLIPYGFETGP